MRECPSAWHTVNIPQMGIADATSNANGQKEGRSGDSNQCVLTDCLNSGFAHPYLVFFMFLSPPWGGVHSRKNGAIYREIPILNPALTHHGLTSKSLSQHFAEKLKFLSCGLREQG